MKRDCYITIQAWMVSELGLHGNELLAYALIYGFSQDGESCYKGSVRYLQDWLDISERTAKSLLASLAEKGLLAKWQENKNGRLVNRYSVNPDAASAELDAEQNPSEMGAEVAPDGCRNYPHTGAEVAPDGCKSCTSMGAKVAPRPKGKTNSNLKGNTPIAPNADKSPEYGSPADVFAAFAGGNAILLESLRAFDEFRRQGKASKSWNGVAADRVCKKLTSLAEAAGVENRISYMIACMDQSIENGWTTVYAVKDYVERSPQVRVHAVGGKDNPRMITPDMDICDFL